MLKIKQKQKQPRLQQSGLLSAGRFPSRIGRRTGYWLVSPCCLAPAAGKAGEVDGAREGVGHVSLTGLEGEIIPGVVVRAALHIGSRPAGCTDVDSEV
jgi:hypothetical protein